MRTTVNLSDAICDWEDAKKIAGGNFSALAEVALKHFVRLPVERQALMIRQHVAERAALTRSDWMGAFWEVLSEELDSPDGSDNPLAPRHRGGYVLVFLLNHPDRQDDERDPFIIHAWPDPSIDRDGVPRNFRFERSESAVDAAIAVSTWLLGHRQPKRAPAGNSMLNVYDVFNFIDAQKRQLVAGYDIVRSAAPMHGRQVALNGMLMALGSFKEGLAVLCEMDPKFGVVRDQFGDDIEKWARLRDDAAHLFDHLFGPPRKGINSPWIPGGLCVAMYTPADDTVKTGSSDSACIRLWAAIERAFELTNALELKQEDIPKEKRSEYVMSIPDQIKSLRSEMSESASAPAPDRARKRKTS